MNIRTSFLRTTAYGTLFTLSTILLSSLTTLS